MLVPHFQQVCSRQLVLSILLSNALFEIPSSLDTEGDPDCPVIEDILMNPKLVPSRSWALEMVRLVAEDAI